MEKDIGIDLIKQENEDLKKENLGLDAENLLLKSKLENLDKIKKKISKVWLFIIISSILLTIISVFILLINISIIMKIMWLIIAIPCYLMVGIATLIKLYRDKNKILDFFIGKLSRNFVKAYFFTDNKKIETKLLRTPTNEIKYKGGLYFLDEKCIFLDIEKTPIIFYKLGIPNPLKFDFWSMVERYNNAPDKTKVFDDEGNLLDLSYSADTIQKFKKDKIFNELHNPNNLANNWVWLIMLGILFIIIMVLIFK